MFRDMEPKPEEPKKEEVLPLKSETFVVQPNVDYSKPIPMDNKQEIGFQ